MSADIIDLDDHREIWISRSMTCSACEKTWVATSQTDAALPFECPACGKMEGMPVVESCGHTTAPKVPIECCYETELGHLYYSGPNETPKLCRCCPECQHECAMET